MQNRQHVRAAGHLLALSGLLLSGYSWAVDAPNACPSGRCPGLGQAFYLSTINTLDISQQTAGARILKDTAIGTCATVSKIGSGSKNSEEFSSTSDLTKSWSVGLGLGNESTPAGGNNIAGYGIDLTGTASANFNRSSTKNESFNSFRLYQNFVDSVVDLNQDSTCYSTQNLDPAFLADFEGLPLSDPKNAAESSTWADYPVFLKRWGSHVQIKQQLGSQYSFWISEDASEKLDIKTLQASACFKIGGYGITLPICPNFGTSEKQSASQKKTVSKLYISGGDAATRNDLMKETTDPVIATERMNAFINKASVSDQAVGFGYTPIWGLLTSVYRQACGQDGAGSKACGNFQRAVNLQAAYEGFLAYQCVKSVARGGLVVQGMVADVPNGNGIYYYQCHQARTGCHSDDDCTNATAEVWWIIKGTGSFCGGGSCIDAQLIDGTSQYRSYVRPLESPLLYDNQDLGVNASCRNDSTATCDLNWGGGKPERYIWVQATNGGGSGTFGVKSLQAMANGASDPGVRAETAQITVQLVDHQALTPAQVKELAHKSEKEHEVPDLVGTLYVTSNDPESQVRINCGDTCFANFKKGWEIQLDAVAQVGKRRFQGWSPNICTNDKNGNGKTIPKRTCLIKVDGDLTVQAYYN